MKEVNELLNKRLPNAKLLMLVIGGSHLYGTNNENSDMDYRGVYIQDEDSILGNNYVPQINDNTNDIILYEIKRFLELLSANNPNIFDIVYATEDCIVYKDASFDILMNLKDSFITKRCHYTFSGYAIEQIKKARGMNKKQNWEKDKIERKDILDFCYFIDKDRSIPLKNVILHKKMDKNLIGLSKLSHTTNNYSMWYDWNSHFKNSKLNILERIVFKSYLNGSNLGFKGICDESSNEVRVSSIPKDLNNPYYIGTICFNSQAYSLHCQEYKQYSEWLSKRNINRWVENKAHGQMLDGKNLMHCVRLIDMCVEIGQGLPINPRRNNRDYLLSIRKGEVDLQSIIDLCESKIKEIDSIFEKSNLPKEVDSGMVNDILIQIRKTNYGK